MAAVVTEIRAGLFTELGESGMMGLSDSLGFTRDEFETARGALIFRIGEERGIVGLAAKTGKPVYVPDCHADARWLGRTDNIRSAYFIPDRDADGHPRVIVLLSPCVDGVDPMQRQVADLLIRFLGRGAESGKFEKRSRQLERGLSEISQVLENVGIGRGGSPEYRSAEVIRRIEALSPREREVLGQLSRGDRVRTISHQLDISPNTVRNHLKAIFRKLGVRSQAELLEFVRPRTNDS